MYNEEKREGRLLMGKTKEQRRNWLQVLTDFVEQKMAPPLLRIAPIDIIAEKAGVSKSALLRFCKKLGYEGYSEFKYEVSKYPRRLWRHQ